MKLHWRTYLNKWADIDWWPWYEYREFPVRHYATHLEIGWLRWSFAVRWWRQ